MRFPVSRHRLWQVAVDAGLVALAWIASWYIRFDARPRLLRPLPRVGRRRPRGRRSCSPSSSRSASTTAGGATSRRRTCGACCAASRSRSSRRFSSSRCSTSIPPTVPRGIWIVDLLLLLAFAMGVRLLARTIIERPSARSLVARGKEVLIVGAGDAAQLILRELQRNPTVGYTAIGLVDDDPRKKNLRLHGVRVLGTTEDLPELLRERRPDELLIAIPSAAGDVRERVVAVARAANVPVKTLPALNELITGDFNLTGQIRPVEVEDLLGREPVDVDLPSIAGLPHRRGRPRHRRRRLDRCRALPADRAHGADAARARGQRRAGPVRDRARARRRARFPRDRRGSRRRRERDEDAAGLREVPTGSGLPRGGVQARAAHGVEPARGRPQQLARHADGGRHRRRVRREALRARLDRQGRQREDRHGPVEGALRVDRRVLGPS